MPPARSRNGTRSGQRAAPPSHPAPDRPLPDRPSEAPIPERPKAERPPAERPPAELPSGRPAMPSRPLPNPPKDKNKPSVPSKLNLKKQPSGNLHYIFILPAHQKANQLLFLYFIRDVSDFIHFYYIFTEEEEDDNSSAASGIQGRINQLNLGKTMKTPPPGMTCNSKNGELLILKILFIT